MAIKRYPLGPQTFERIRREDRLYIDKTEYVYKMTHSDYTYVFLSRPRRFGKPLLTSTITSYFEGRKDLFEGLAIERLETEWEDIPCCSSVWQTANTWTRVSSNAICLKRLARTRCGLA